MIIKLGFGYSSFVLPVLTGIWGIWFFMHKDFQSIGIPSIFILASTALTSITTGYLQIAYYGLDSLSFTFSGMTGGVIAILFYDFVGGIGSFLLIAALWLVLIRSYFNLSFYTPFKKMYSSFEKNRKEKQLISDDIQAEKEKKEHTQNLLNKIDEQRSKDLPISPVQMGSSRVDNERHCLLYTSDAADE